MGEPTPKVSGKFEVSVNGKLIHSKAAGEGFPIKLMSILGFFGLGSNDDSHVAKMDKIVKAIRDQL